MTRSANTGTVTDTSRRHSILYIGELVIKTRHISYQFNSKLQAFHCFIMLHGIYSYLHEKIFPYIPLLFTSMSTHLLLPNSFYLSASPYPVPPCITPTSALGPIECPHSLPLFSALPYAYASTIEKYGSGGGGGVAAHASLSQLLSIRIRTLLLH